MTLPPFPVDDSALDMVWVALHPGPEAERTSLSDLCSLYSELGGSDTGAVAEVIGDVRHMRDQQYHPADIITALIVEVRRLRGGAG